MSVEDQGARWVDAFEQAIELSGRPGSSLVELDLDPDDAGLRAGNDALIGRARELAGADVLVTVVRPLGGEDPPSMTDDLVDRARRDGFFVVEIDPRG